MLLEIVFALLAGLGLGWIIGWALGQSRTRMETQRAGQLEASIEITKGELKSAQQELEKSGKEKSDLKDANSQSDASQREEIARLKAELAGAEKNGERAANALEEQRAENNRVRDELSQSQADLAALRTKLEEEQNKAQEKLDLLKEAGNQLSDHFSSLAGKALSDNNEAFLSFAKQELGAKEAAITGLLKPVGDTLDKLQAATHDLEVKREGAYGKVLAEIDSIHETHQSLRRETAQLIQALRAPKARGNWGELQLKRCIEFAGMVEHASFDVEVFVRGDDVSVKPDCIIHLPNERTIVIDVKTPFDAFLDAMSSTDETIRELRLADHANRVREHLGQLSAKAYWKQFKDSPDFVVCFLSSEVLFSAALEQDPGLIEFGSNSNVILATPTTLIALLKAVAYGWQQMEVTRNAIAIREAGEKLYDKLTTAQDYVSKMGKAISAVVGHYNGLLGCIEGGRGVFAQARRLHDLGIGQEQLSETRLLDPNVRDLRDTEWSPSGSLFIAAEVEDDS
jgi:DNA recombination protein RmuC